MFRSQAFECDRCPHEGSTQLRRAARETTSARFGLDDSSTARKTGRLDRLDRVGRTTQQTKQTSGAGGPLRRHDDELTSEFRFFHGVLRGRESAQQRLSGGLRRERDEDLRGIRPLAPADRSDSTRHTRVGPGFQGLHVDEALF
ncbi:MAG: hypothetical protein JRJ05_12940 [Deltaproteobacteria bacterium]|nr:hypothetical protein [Deltaproteobacteria bacterium]